MKLFSSLKLRDDTPFYQIYHYKPNVSKLRKFGGTVYANIPKNEITSKLDKRAIRGAFLGFPRNSGGVILLEDGKGEPKIYPYLVSESQAPDRPLTDQENADEVTGSITGDQLDHSTTSDQNLDDSIQLWTSAQREGFGNPPEGSSGGAQNWSGSTIFINGHGTSPTNEILGRENQSRGLGTHGGSSPHQILARETIHRELGPHLREASILPIEQGGVSSMICHM